jgi:hypothetical protein
VPKQHQCVLLARARDRNSLMPLSLRRIGSRRGDAEVRLA